DGKATLVPGVMEHIERAGVHSGDSMAVFPPVNLSDRVISRMVAAACDLAREIGVRGLMNIQFVVAPTEGSGGEAVPQILEVNPRGSRTVPFLAKVTGIPMVDLATRAMMGQSLSELGYESGLWRLDARGRLHGAEPEVRSKSKGTVLSEAEISRLMDGTAVSRSLFSGAPFYAVKAPVFSFQKLARVEPSLGPEMKSTGEIMGIDSTFEGALYKSLVASGISLPTGGVVVISVNDADKPAAIEIAKSLSARGHEIACTGGTHRALQAAGVASQRVAKISEGSPHLLDLVMSRRVSLLINTPGTDAETEAEASRIRRGCIETGVACITNIDTAEALVKALPFFEDLREPRAFGSTSTSGGRADLSGRRWVAASHVAELRHRFLEFRDLLVDQFREARRKLGEGSKGSVLGNPVVVESFLGADSWGDVKVELEGRARPKLKAIHRGHPTTHAREVRVFGEPPEQREFVGAQRKIEAWGPTSPGGRADDRLTRIEGQSPCRRQPVGHDLGRLVAKVLVIGGSEVLHHREERKGAGRGGLPPVDGELCTRPKEDLGGLGRDAGGELAKAKRPALGQVCENSRREHPVKPEHVPVRHTHPRVQRLRSKADEVQHGDLVLHGRGRSEGVLG
ncbi:MAG: Carbamoylphosphate synthase large subunit (splitin MJ), partial [Armatimonadetes bacterium OLB18]